MILFFKLYYLRYWDDFNDLQFKENKNSIYEWPTLKYNRKEELQNLTRYDCQDF